MSDNFNTSDYVLTVTTAPINDDYITAIWASDGGHKMPRDDTYVSDHIDMTNNAWDGTTINIWSAKNEIVSFNLMLEAQGKTADGITIDFSKLDDGNGHTIENTVIPIGDGVFDYVGRPIENFYTRYLEIRGMSGQQFGGCYFGYDERQCPPKFRSTGVNVSACPEHGECRASNNTWINRPDHNKYYPSILIPIEIQGSFTIQEGESQQLWTDIYIPKTTQTGVYTGSYKIFRNQFIEIITINRSNIFKRAIPCSSKNLNRVCSV